MWRIAADFLSSATVPVPPAGRTSRSLPPMDRRERGTHARAGLMMIATVIVTLN
jgi:hypothetical protein